MEGSRGHSRLGNWQALGLRWPSRRITHSWRSNENFIRLQDELAGTENRIATERRRYNDTVRDFNTAVQQFPSNVIAGPFSFAPREYFEADEQAQEIPTVQF